MAFRPASADDLKALEAALRLRAAEEAERHAAEARARQALDHEAALFRNAVGDVTPLRGAQRREPVPAAPSPEALQRQRDERAALEESLSDEFDAETLLDADDRLSWHRDGLGRDVVRKLRRGAWVIQDELDLHGARRDEARVLLGEFLRDAVRRGRRCVRVIHGKGLGSVDRQPVLKGKVQSWLMQKSEVLAFCQARPHDGGAGALLVLLRASGPA